MKWKSHLQIAKLVGSKLEFSKENILKLAEGSITPDKWQDHSHHHNRKYLDKTIKERILKARKLFLKNSPKYYFEIGVVLHYIADRLIPIKSYSAHLSVEKEIAELLPSDKQDKSRKYAEDIKNQLEKMKEMVQDFKIEDEAKTLLFDPNLTKGKCNTLKLALINLPKHIGSELLFYIAHLISIGVVSSIISRDSPPQLLLEKFKYAIDSISDAIPKFKFYSRLEIVITTPTLPILYSTYGRIGFFGYLIIFLANLLSIILLALILRKKNLLNNYRRFHAYSKTLFIFFLIASLATFVVGMFNSIFFPASGFLALIALLHLFHPKIPIPKEFEEEIDWYNWEEILKQ